MSDESPLRKLTRTGTPMVMAVFVVTATTGVLLFFHLGERLIKELHEWIGLAMVVGAVLHIARNWKAILQHLRRPPLWIFAALALTAAAAFIVPALGQGERRGGDGQRQLVRALLRAPIDQIAPVLSTTPEGLAARLADAGFKVEGTGSSLADIARASGKEPREALDIAVASLPQESGGPPR